LPIIDMYMTPELLCISESQDFYVG
jgi:hypothetical protein